MMVRVLYVEWLRNGRVGRRLYIDSKLAKCMDCLSFFISIFCKTIMIILLDLEHFKISTNQLLYYHFKLNLGKVEIETFQSIFSGLYMKINKKIVIF